MPSSRTKAPKLLIFLSRFVWGVTFPAGKRALERIDPAIVI